MPPNDPQQQTLPWWRYLVWLLVIIAFSYYWLGVTQNRQQQELSYSEFKQKIRANEIAYVVLQGQTITGQYKAAEDWTGSGQPIAQRFVTTLPPLDDAGLMPLLEQHGVEVHARSTEGSWWSRLLIAVVPWILIIGLFWYLTGRMQRRITGGEGPGGLFGFAKSRAKRFRRGESEITFDDVAGLENAKSDLREITGYLQDPERAVDGPLLSPLHYQLCC